MLAHCDRATSADELSGINIGYGKMRTAIASKRQVDDQTRRTKQRNSLEAALAECRADRQRLISENAALLLRAVTAEEALARIKWGRPHAVKMTDDRPEAS